MRYFKILLIFVTALYLTNCSDKRISNEELEIAKENLLKAIDKFNKAFQEGNVIVLESMITENYLHTNGNSKSISRKDWLDYLRKREGEIKTGNLEVVGYKIDDLEVVLYGNTGIVTGKILVSNKRMKEIQTNEYRVTNVWINEAGNWKRAGFHDGKIK